MLNAFLKKYGNYGVLIAAFAFLWQVSSTMIAIGNHTLTELHSATQAVNLLTVEVANFKIEQQVKQDKVDAHEAKQDDALNMLKVDVARLKTRANLAMNTLDCLKPYFNLSDLGITYDCNEYLLATNP